MDAEELVGRDSELTLLAGLVRDVSAGRGGALLIEGEPGIGKSALVRAALTGAGGLGCEVFWGTGDELDQALPLVPFLKALRVREVTSPRRTAIARLLAGENADDHGADVPAVLAEQLLALIAEECARRPVILVIDDLQWADPDSVRLWGRLIRTARQMPLLLAGLMRPVPRREDLLAVRRMAAKDTRLRLSELPDDAVGGLVAALSGGVPDAGLLKLAATAGGNPLYLTELVAVLRRSSRIAIGGTGTAALTEGPVPGSLSAAIADRLGFVSGEVRDVLHAAALLGVNFEISDLAIVSGRGGVAGLLGVLDEAHTAGVLAESREGFGFRHPLIRAALYEEMPAPVRATWHRDAGRALAAAGVPAYRVARQLLQAASMSGSSGDLVDEWMLNWIDGAADSLVGPAPGVAAELLPLAIAACPEGSARQVRLVSRLADALYRIGDRPGAERQAMRVLDHATDRDVLMDLHWTLAQCRMLTGRSPESLAVLDQALAAPGISDRHRARLLVLASRTHFMDGHMKEAARVADTALTAASATSDTWAKAWALAALANARMAQGDVFESLSMHDRAIAVTQSDPALSDMRLLLQINKAATLGNIDQYEQAFAVLRSVLQTAGQTGTALRQSQAHSTFAQMYWEIGRWDDALAEIAILPLDLNEPAGACCEYGVAAVICFHRGETDMARRRLADAAPYAERVGKHRVVPPLVLARSMERESAGALQEALAVLTDAFENSPDEVQATEELLPDTVRLALLTGDSRTAESVAARADAGAGSEIPHRQAVALYCRGLLAHDAARLLKAAERYTQAGHPLMKAKALEAAAAEFTRNGDQDQARTALDAAAAAYTSLGATADLARLRLQPGRG